MKTTITTTSSSLKLAGILLITLLSSTDLFSQTAPVKNYKNNLVIAPIIRNEHGAKHVTTPAKPKNYTVLAAKNFPKLECEKAPALIAMNESEEFDYTLLCGEKVNFRKEESELQMLAIK